jgi:hypothetical protein
MTQFTQKGQDGGVEKQEDLVVIGFSVQVRNNSLFIRMAASLL